MTQEEYEQKLQALDLRAYEKGGEKQLQPHAASSYEDAQDRICAFWGKTHWVLEELSHNTNIDAKTKEVLNILSELLDAQCSL